MTKHPAPKGAQRGAFEQIATGKSCPPMTRQTRDALLRKGLIEHIGDIVIGRDAFGAVKIPQYVVPLHLHAQWCQWCAEQDA